MPIEILMPALSPTMKEGNLARWLKREGDKIKAGDVIAEIETDKATMEIEAVDEGIMGKIIIADGSENVAINSLIALILEEGENKEVLKNYQKKEIKTIMKSEEKKLNARSEVKKNEARGQDNKIAASPLAKRIADEKNIDLAKISGSGPHGRIIRDDILNFAPNFSKTSDNIMRNPQEFREIKNNHIRKIIAKKLLEAKQTVPHFYLNLELKIDKLLELRIALNESSPSHKISLNDLLIKAVALALTKVPAANSSWTENAILIYNNIDISVAVAIDDGLITPIVKNADQKSIFAISAEMKKLIKSAQENKLQPEEFQGGSFSISNLGMYGIDNFSAIINPPQACILAVGAGVTKPIVENGQIKIAHLMSVTLSCDHRAVDGAIGAQFLQALKKIIENPIIMMI